MNTSRPHTPSDLLPDLAPARDQRAVASRAAHHHGNLGAHITQIQAWRDAAPTTLNLDTIAYLAATLTHPQVRDAVLLTAAGADPSEGVIGHVIRRALFGTNQPTEHTHRTIAVLGVVAAHSHHLPYMAAHALAALGLLTWWTGDSARATTAATRALTYTSHHRLAHMVLLMTAADMTPPWAEDEQTATSQETAHV